MSIKLTYFDIRGFAEPMRLLLADKNIQYEDERVNFEQWAKIKPKMVFGQIPCLYTGDREIVQTGAIIRHLGRVYDLNGTTEAETTFIDMFYEGVRDLHTKYEQMVYENYKNGKDEYINKTLPVEIQKIKKLFRTQREIRGGRQGTISYVDYVLFEQLDIHLILISTALDATPALKRFHGRFAERPNLKAYLKKRTELNPLVNGNGKQ